MVRFDQDPFFESKTNFEFYITVNDKYLGPKYVKNSDWTIDKVNSINHAIKFKLIEGVYLDDRITYRIQLVDGNNTSYLKWHNNEPWMSNWFDIKKDGWGNINADSRLILFQMGYVSPFVWKMFNANGWGEITMGGSTLFTIKPINISNKDFFGDLTFDSHGRAHNPCAYDIGRIKSGECYSTYDYNYTNDDNNKVYEIACNLDPNNSVCVDWAKNTTKTSMVGNVYDSKCNTLDSMSTSPCKDIYVKENPNFSKKWESLCENETVDDRCACVNETQIKHNADITLGKLKTNSIETIDNMIAPQYKGIKGLEDEKTLETELDTLKNTYKETLDKTFATVKTSLDSNPVCFNQKCTDGSRVTVKPCSGNIIINNDICAQSIINNLKNNTVGGSVINDIKGCESGSKTLVGDTYKLISSHIGDKIIASYTSILDKYMEYFETDIEAIKDEISKKETYIHNSNLDLNNKYSIQTILETATEVETKVIELVKEHYNGILADYKVKLQTLYTDIQVLTSTVTSKSNNIYTTLSNRKIELTDTKANIDLQIFYYNRYIHSLRTALNDIDFKLDSIIDYIKLLTTDINALKPTIVILNILSKSIEIASIKSQINTSDINVSEVLLNIDKLFTSSLYTITNNLELILAQRKSAIIKVNNATFDDKEYDSEIQSIFNMYIMNIQARLDVPLIELKNIYISILYRKLIETQIIINNIAFELQPTNIHPDIKKWFIQNKIDLYKLYIGDINIDILMLDNFFDKTLTTNLRSAITTQNTNTRSFNNLYKTYTDSSKSLGFDVMFNEYPKSEYKDEPEPTPEPTPKPIPISETTSSYNIYISIIVSIIVLFLICLLVYWFAL